jgi:hypothetical protein
VKAMREELRKNYKRFYIDFRIEDWLKISIRAKYAKMKPTTFIKRMAVDGKMSVYDTKPMNSLTLAINRIGKNINQIVHLANEVHSVNMTDIELLSEKLDLIKNEICEHQRYAVYERSDL